ncbi:hypothetical protein LX15_001622 [Streptoalloteichus tenebrarius]|uniref:Uncharacterized protein n=1 Tax=Streptoalloteichus tenebrarius (strain ATCC 17920 / DSM 40477 / JCM 4838 / CBS 697.72 / NBRC 16177 / NCIMB 11028 / NRRL B-12390 / A12253. 1 / ISP 5477) TaxID=1933 RepID=A0ABT1HQY6_STRSD|nr:hypothetical protein [Streptoalloteichus tenebrarius]
MSGRRPLAFASFITVTIRATRVFHWQVGADMPESVAVGTSRLRVVPAHPCLA